MLTPEQKLEAENKLKNMSAELRLQQEVKQKIKNNTHQLLELVNSLRQNSKGQKQLVTKLITGSLLKKIISLESKNRMLGQVEERIKSDKEKIRKQFLRAIDQKANYQAQIENIKKTIQNIRKTVQESVNEEQKKRNDVERDLEKSLTEIREKIATFNKESQQIQAQIGPLKEKVDQIKSKMEGLQGNYKKQAQQKDDEVQNEKEQLLEKLKVLQDQMAQVTELNKEFSGLQKKNFDSKLSIHLRTQKFPEYSNSFISTADTIGQCKQQLVKGVHRLNVAKQKVQQSIERNKQISEQYLSKLKQKTEKEKKIETLKGQKEIVRARILELQKKIKEKAGGN